VKAAGGTIAEQQFTTDKATDFSAILTQIKGKKPDVVFFGGMDAVAGPMLRQMKQLGIKAKFMGGDGVCTAELPKLAAGALGDDVVTCAVAGGVDAAHKGAMDKFRADFKKKFGTDVQIYAPYTYDAAMVMAEAMAKAGSAEPAKYLPYLAKVKHAGITGDIAFVAYGDIRDGALTLYTFKGGKRTLIEVVK
jgi:branched-chain amino acid transport system substrate-binding protein